MQVRDTILLADDSAEVRAELRRMFEEKFNILESENGEQALMLLGQNSNCVAAVLIDSDMPGLDGFQVLEEIERMGLLSTIPVILIIEAGCVESEKRAFTLGAQDIIPRPLHPVVVERRVTNLISLYHNNWVLEKRVREQTAVLQHSNEVMVDALSSIIECRSVESGQHILRIRRFTKILLEEIGRCCPEYELNERLIQTISSASALHDIGKISIPDAILNKPGALTAAEFEVMKSHASAGSEILKSLNGVGDQEYLRYAYNICRYHHERWDGSGYPDGLAGDSIPICAQVVGIADAYDALTTERVYKKAMKCGAAANMILNGECGSFSPKLLECFKHVRKEFENLAKAYADGYSPKSDSISAPLPPPGQTAPNTLQAALRKYQALLHHLNATVVEIDHDQDEYHVVYNPNPDFVPIASATSFGEALQRLAEKAVHPDDRAMLVEQLNDYLDDFFASGLRKRTRSYRIGGADGEYHYYDATIIRIETDDGSRKAACIWQRSSSGKPVLEKAEHFDAADMSSLMGNTQHCINDRFLTMRNVSKRLCALLDYTEDEIYGICGGRLIELIMPAERAHVLRQVSEQFVLSNWCEVEMPMLARDGSTVWALAKGVLNKGEDGLEHIYGMLLNITKSKQAQENIRLAHERNELLMEYSSDIVFEWDFATDTLYCSPKWEERFGYKNITDNATKNIEKMSHFHPDDLPDVIEKFQSLRRGERFAETTVRIVDSKGHYVWNRIRATGQLDSEGRIIKAIGVIIDVDHQLRSAQSLMDSTERDSLTGLYNKDVTRRKVEEALGSMKRDVLSALAIIDLDDFKLVNDRYGHLYGDEVLVQVSSEISGMFRESDIVGRIGGDEFLVYMNDVPDKALVAKRCEALIERIKTLFEKEMERCSLAVSVGVAFAPENGVAYQELFQHADRALYMAKDKGKGCCVCYDPSAVVDLHRTTVSMRIDSDEQPGMANNSFANYIFECLYESGNVYETIDTVLTLIGQQINVSRVYIFENSSDNLYCSNTFEWCNEGVSPEIDSLQNVSYETDIPDYEKNFNERGVFYVPDVSRLPQHLRDILEPQGIKSLLHCAIRDNGVFRGYVGFDDCSTARLWTQEQVDLLTTLAQMLSVFLLKKRVQDSTEEMVKDLNLILNNQYAWVYVIDPDSYELRFVNSRTMETVPELKLGMKCHEVMMGNSEPCQNCPARICGDRGSGLIENKRLGLRVNTQADSIHWNGEKAWLITCRNAEK